MMKCCSKCKQTLPLSMFYKKKESLDGLRYECKLCKRDLRTDRNNHTATYKKAHAKYCKKFPFKRKAKNAVNNAIKAGKLQKQSCLHCGGKAHAHHTDYTRPLDVMWLCPKHHKTWHRLFVPLIPEVTHAQ